VAENDNSDKYWGFAFVAIIAAALLVIAIIPALLGAAAYLLVRSHLSKRDFWVLCAIGGTAALITTYTSASLYLGWIWGAAIERDFSVDGFPFLTVLAWATLFTGAFGLLLGTRIADRVPFLSKGRGKPTVRESILPTEKEKTLVSSIVSAPGTLATPLNTTLNKNTEPSGSRKFKIGSNGAGKDVFLSEAQIKTHAMILGATGSGKTEAIKVLAGGLLDLGWSGMVLDLKEDVAPGGLREWCYDYSNSHNTAYQELRLSDPESKSWFNPLEGMGPDEIRDTILALQDFDDA